MNIQKVSNTNFKGYDARKVKGFFVGSNSPFIKDLQSIGRSQGFDIYSKLSNGKFIFCDKAINNLIPYERNSLWAQDIWTFCKNKIFSSQSRTQTQPILDFFGIDYQKREHHLSGGNIFIVDNNGTDEIFVGVNELKKFSIQQLKDNYEVETVHVLPQMDYHLDLFIRPLDKKRILIADDNLTLDILKKGREQLKTFLEEHQEISSILGKVILDRFNSTIYTFRDAMQSNNLPQTEKLSKILKFAGYEPIPVPGRIYQTHNYTDGTSFLSHDCNYINANVIINDKNELVYITNKSSIDKQLGLKNELVKKFKFKFQEEFAKTLAPYIKRKNIYFVDGNDNFVSEKMLKELQGGIHCACSEIPATAVPNFIDYD